MDAITLAIITAKGVRESVKLLVEGASALDKAELRLRLVNVAGDLGDLALQVQDLQQYLRSKDAEIEELKEAVRKKGAAFKLGDAYWIGDKHSIEPQDGPYCLRCFEVDHAFRSLSRGYKHPFGHGKECAECGRFFDKDNTRWEHLRRPPKE